MKATRIVSLILLTCIIANADFSYVLTRKTTGGNLADWFHGVNEVVKYYLKGEKMMIDTPAKRTIIDFDAQTITTLNRTLKLWGVKKMDPPEKAAAVEVPPLPLGVLPTGQQKEVAGFISNGGRGSTFIEMAVFSGGPVMRIQVDHEMWVSADVPGLSEMHAFFKKHAEDFPWNELAPGTSPAAQIARERLRRSIPDSQGILIQEVLRAKLPYIPQIGPMPPMSPERAEKMQQAIDNLVKAAKSGAALVELTTDVGQFSTADLPDSVFTVPAGYDRMAE